MTNYALAGFSSFGSEYTTPAGPAAAGPTDVTLIAIATSIGAVVVILIVVVVIAVGVTCRKWSKCRYVPTPLHTTPYT